MGVVFVLYVTCLLLMILKSSLLLWKVWRIFLRLVKKNPRQRVNLMQWQYLFQKLKGLIRLKIYSNTRTMIYTKSALRFSKLTLALKRRKKWLPLRLKWKEIRLDSEWISNKLLEHLISPSHKVYYTVHKRIVLLGIAIEALIPSTRLSRS